MKALALNNGVLGLIAIPCLRAYPLFQAGFLIVLSEMQVACGSSATFQFFSASIYTEMLSPQTLILVCRRTLYQLHGEVQAGLLFQNWLFVLFYYYYFYLTFLNYARSPS
jgi:hypothetical protein